MKDAPIGKWLVALAVGTTLIVIPEPATTGAGILIVLGTLGFKAGEMAGVID